MIGLEACAPAHMAAPREIVREAVFREGGSGLQQTGLGRPHCCLPVGQFEWRKSKLSE